MAVQMPDQCYILRTIQIKRAFLKGLTYAMSAPHYRPSNQPLTKYPHKLSRFFVQTLMIAPQKLWQTLKKFDDPFLNYNIYSFLIALVLSLCVLSKH